MKLTKKYHIYVNGYCHYPNLDEVQFYNTWNSLKKVSDNISYEEVIDNKEEYSLEGKIY